MFAGKAMDAKAYQEARKKMKEKKLDELLKAASAFELAYDAAGGAWELSNDDDEEEEESDSDSSGEDDEDDEDED